MREMSNASKRHYFKCHNPSDSETYFEDLKERDINCMSYGFVDAIPGKLIADIVNLLEGESMSVRRVEVIFAIIIEYFKERPFLRKNT